MKISTIPSIYRNVNRLTEIVSVLSKYRLADWLSNIQLEFAKLLQVNLRAVGNSARLRRWRVYCRIRQGMDSALPFARVEAVGAIRPFPRTRQPERATPHSFIHRKTVHVWHRPLKRL